MNGLLNIFKPPGPTSYDMIRRIKKVWGLDRPLKIGHAGTLDPFAEGVLLLLFGKATKLSGQLVSLPKKYAGVMRLGCSMDTDDPTGRVIQRAPLEVLALLNQEKIVQACANLMGEIDQTPPAFSALHFKGRRLYDLARLGRPMTLEPRRVRIDEFIIENIDFFESPSREKILPRVAFRVTVGRGAYIRSLARDLGVMLGVGGYLESLERTAVGPFLSGQALRLNGAFDDDRAGPSPRPVGEERAESSREDSSRIAAHMLNYEQTLSCLAGIESASSR